jgi:hypothetical protein
MNNCIINPPPIIEKERNTSTNTIIQDLFNDLVDSSNFDNCENVVEIKNDHDDFSRFKRIPIGTFWQSQRLSRTRTSNYQQTLVRKKRRGPRITDGLDSTLLSGLNHGSKERNFTVENSFLNLGDDYFDK